jgi:SAM-dependent methyltransferase
MKLLNLGCGTRASSFNGCVNIDWTIYLRLKSNPVLRTFVAPLVLRGHRLDRFHSLPDNILVHNLAKGIPFSDQSVDAVYHSHLLEHLDKNVAIRFTQEIYRVLRPNGLLRISIPDFERYARDYVNALDSNEQAYKSISYDTDKFIHNLIAQSVMRDSPGTEKQNPFLRILENLILGDARGRGYTHQWMYDKYSIHNLLSSLGFMNITIIMYNESQIPDWDLIALDSMPDGSEYLPESMYIEARKP